MTRWPWRSMRKIEPSSASAARSNSGSVGVADDDAVAGDGVVALDDALHDGWPQPALTTLPLLMQPVQTCIALRRAADQGLAHAGCSGSSDAWCAGGSATRSCRTGALAAHLTYCCHDDALPRRDRQRAWTMLPADRVSDVRPAGSRPVVSSSCTVGSSSLDAPRRCPRWSGSRPRKRCASTGRSPSATRCRPTQPGINRLNVYPVPDGDTGTNMALTLESVVAELDGRRPDLAPTCDGHQPRVAHGRPGQLRRDPLPDPAGPGRRR